MESPNTRYIERLDHLRFYAAALVVVFHTILLLRGPTTHAKISYPLFEQGHIGVQFFMVISGFILGVITFKHKINYFRFCINRILRIYPLLIMVVSLAYFAADLENPQNLLNWIISVLPLSNLSRLNYGEFGGQLWSIAVELQFYMMFPILLQMLQEKGWMYYASLVGLMIILRSSVFILHGTVHNLSYFTIFGSLDVFLVGHLLGTYYCNASKNYFSHPCWLIASVTVLNLLVWIIFSRPQFFHVRESSGVSSDWLWIFWPDIAAGLCGFFLITYLRSNLFIPLNRMLSQFGKYSYSVYLWHIMIILLVFHQVGHLPGTGDVYLIAVFVVLPLSILLAAASYHIIEQPFLSWRVTYVTADDDRPKVRILEEERIL